MKLSLTTDASGRRLTAALSGPVSYLSRLRAFERACRHPDWPRIEMLLIDFTLGWHVVGPPADKLAFVDALRGRGDLAGKRIAYLNCPIEQVAELRQLAEQVGFDAEMFQTRSLAIDWLEGRAVAPSAARPRAIA